MSIKRDRSSNCKRLMNKRLQQNIYSNFHDKSTPQDVKKESVVDFLNRGGKIQKLKGKALTDKDLTFNGYKPTGNAKNLGKV